METMQETNTAEYRTTKMREQNLARRQVRRRWWRKGRDHLRPGSTTYPHEGRNQGYIGKLLKKRNSSRATGNHAAVLRSLGTNKTITTANLENNCHNQQTPSFAPSFLGRPVRSLVKTSTPPTRAPRTLNELGIGT